MTDKDYSQVKRLFDLPEFQLKNTPLDDCLCSKINGKWIPVSTREVCDMVHRVSLGLLKAGIGPGDKIAMVTTTNRPEWNIVDLALLQVGAINVPLYPTLTEPDYQYIMTEAEIVMCFVSDAGLANKVRTIMPNVPTLKSLYTFDDVSGFPSWKEIPVHADPALETRLRALKDSIKEDDLATIIYTSGTTGVPKGVMLSHKNIISNTLACLDRIPHEKGYRGLSFLPVSHIYERMLQYLYMLTGLGIYFAESIDTIGENIREVKPHVFVAVPRLLEKVFDRIMARGRELTGIKKKLFFWSLRVAEKYDPQKRNIFYRLQLGIARKLVFSKWQEALGGNIKAIASGSAPLQPRLARIFLAAGINVWEGYGLTETSPVVAVNCSKNNGIMIGTVGRPVPGVEVRIAEDGEIMIKGPNVMLGYYKKPEMTREVIEPDGWFHTGDIGELTEGQFLKITDRKKEMFKTSGGKYVAPQLIENALKASPYIEQVLVVGDARKFPAALIVPNFAYIKENFAAAGKDAGSHQDICLDPEVRKIIAGEIEKVNKNLGHWEQIKKFELLPQEWSLQTGEMTPKMSLKRKVITEKFSAIIDKIYA
jgi:long-chain acyl-CoA synthetase